MSKDQLELEEFLARYAEPAVRPKPAAEIMVLGNLPSFIGPRLDIGRNGRKRWVTRLDKRPKPDAFTMGYPVL